MKKLLAIVLALLMPLCASAEAMGFTVRIDIDGEGFTAAASSAMMEVGAEAAEAEKIADMIRQLVDGAGFEVKVDDNAFYLELQLCGGKLFDMTVYEQDEKRLFTSSMLSGYALEEKVESNATAVQQYNWEAASQSITDALLNWCAGIEKTEAVGFFVGDAFEGGTKCTIWTLDDKMLTQLMDAVLTEEVRAALAVMYEESGRDSEEILAAFDQANKDVAKDNKYSYVLRAVENDEKLIGLSMTVLQGAEQVATASLGFKVDGVRLVIGLGFEKQNYWVEADASWAVTNNEKSVRVTARECAANKNEAYAYVRGTMTPVNIGEWTYNAVSGDDGYAWDSALSANGAVLLSGKGTAVPDEMKYDGVVSVGAASNKLLDVSYSVHPADPLPELDTALTTCSISDPADAELLEKLSNQLVAAISARMLKLLPMDLILEMSK